MNKQQFLTRFLLSSRDQTPLLPSIHHSENAIPCAVLIPLIEINREVFVILTKRAEHLRKHAGQISFPGGKVEPDDKNFTDTALRESFEEIGIPAEKVEVIGQLKNYQTLTGYGITPIVGFISKDIEFIADKNEVAEIFTVPLDYFYRREHYIEITIRQKEHLKKVNFIPYQQYNIWGATASILKGLAKITAAPFN